MRTLDHSLAVVVVQFSTNATLVTEGGLVGVDMESLEVPVALKESLEFGYYDGKLQADKYQYKDTVWYYLESMACY